MPILVPAHPLFGEGLRAERAQNEYEADIVVLIPGAGWAVIEIKGGDVRRVHGAWEQRQKGLWQPIEPRGAGAELRASAAALP